MTNRSFIRIIHSCTAFTKRLHVGHCLFNVLIQSLLLHEPPVWHGCRTIGGGHFVGVRVYWASGAQRCLIRQGPFVLSFPPQRCLHFCLNLLANFPGKLPSFFLCSCRQRCLPALCDVWLHLAPHSSAGWRGNQASPWKPGSGVSVPQMQFTDM